MTTDELLSTLQHLETELHQEETRRDPSRMDMLLHPEFQEFSRCGHRYSRAEVVTEFSASDVEFSTVVSWGFSVAIIAEHIALLTYVSAHQDRRMKTSRVPPDNALQTRPSSWTAAFGILVGLSIGRQNFRRLRWLAMMPNGLVLCFYGFFLVVFGLGGSR